MEILKNDRIFFKPKYYSYFKRVWLQIHVTALILIIIGIPGILVFVNDYALFIIYISLFPMIFILVISSIYINQNYLKSLSINIKVKNIVLEIVKYDKDPEMITINFSELEVRVTQIQYSYDVWYKIQFYKNRKLVFQQREFREWNKATFDEIAAEIKKLKSNKLQKR